MRCVCKEQESMGWATESLWVAAMKTSQLCQITFFVWLFLTFVWSFWYPQDIDCQAVSLIVSTCECGPLGSGLCLRQEDCGGQTGRGSTGFCKGFYYYSIHFFFEYCFMFITKTNRFLMFFFPPKCPEKLQFLSLLVNEKVCLRLYI